MSFIDDLTWRGLIQQASDPRLGELMAGEKFSLYSGFDPTAPSLHVGNLMPIFGLRRAQQHGHTPVALVGGATGMIGDPSGKAGERTLKPLEEIDANLAAMRKQLEKLLDFSPGLSNSAVMVNNRDWFQGYGYLEFLRDIGKHFSVNMMMAKESVRARLEDRESGISYTEFSYMLIQAYDYLHLYDKHNCRLQIGGSEQWGNITAGMDLIRRLRSKETYALTLPLLLDAQGKKFGKSESGAVWLDPERTSTYDFYQYFFRTDDRDVIKVLRFLTFLDQKTIAELEEQLRVAPEKREAQRALAREMTTLVHGAEETRRAEEAASALFAQRAAGGAPEGAPTFDVRLEPPMLLIDAIVQSGLCKSKGEAKREITGGGIYVNDARIDADRPLTGDDVKNGVILLRRGKKNYMVLKIVPA
jgi:tyrosyl-tRNA synthetase